MDPQSINADQVYQFLAELLATALQAGEVRITRELHTAMLHYTTPLTSEFFGKSIGAFEEIIRSRPSMFSASDLNRASDLARALRRQWFS